MGASRAWNSSPASRPRRLEDGADDAAVRCSDGPDAEGGSGGGQWRGKDDLRSTLSQTKGAYPTSLPVDKSSFRQDVSPTWLLMAAEFGGRRVADRGRTQRG